MECRQRGFYCKWVGYFNAELLFLEGRKMSGSLQFYGRYFFANLWRRQKSIEISRHLSVNKIRDFWHGCCIHHCMEKRDARILDPKTQEEVCRRAIKMLQKVRTQQSVADELEVGRTRVNGWWKRFQEEVWESLWTQKRGPKKRSRKLTVEQEEEVQRLIADRIPTPRRQASLLPD